MKFLLSEKTKSNLALFLSGMLFGVSSPLAKYMGKWLSPFSVILVRFIFALPFALLSSSFDTKLSKKNIIQLILFASLFPISVCLYTFSLFNTKVSLAIFSFYISNLLSSVIIGYYFNKEEFSIKKIIGFLCAICAVIAFSNSSVDLEINIGILLGYLSGFFQTIASLYQKKLSKEIKQDFLILSQILGGIILATLAILIIRDYSILNLTINGIILGVVFGFIFYLINYLMIYGFKNADISIGTILLSSELIFGPIMAYFVFSERLTFLEIIGGILICISVVLVAFDSDNLHWSRPDLTTSSPRELIF